MEIKLQRSTYKSKCQINPIQIRLKNNFLTQWVTGFDQVVGYVPSKNEHEFNRVGFEQSKSPMSNYLWHTCTVTDMVNCESCNGSKATAFSWISTVYITTPRQWPHVCGKELCLTTLPSVKQMSPLLSLQNNRAVRFFIFSCLKLCLHDTIPCWFRPAVQSIMSLVGAM